MNLDAIANQLKEMSEPIVLIYAFNATGKTRLSVAYKNATKDSKTGKHAGVYYNAFSEDLFAWDNDEKNDGVGIKLKIGKSNLNQFHSYLYENQDSIMQNLALYRPRYHFKLNPYDNLELGIESVSFFVDEDSEQAIKISRGEERIFVWCFFLALLEVDSWVDEQNAHIFIDDPVSSLDEHNIFITANTLLQQIERNFKNKRIIITTHHIGLFSILSNRLTKGEKSDRYKNLTGLRILKKVGDELMLEPPPRNVFLYHLHLLQILDEASKEQLYTYHFALLRQLLENIASFLGTGRMGHTLKEIGIENVDDVATMVNSHSHKTSYYFQTEMMSDADESVFMDILKKIIAKYKFTFHASKT